MIQKTNIKRFLRLSVLLLLVVAIVFCFQKDVIAEDKKDDSTFKALEKIKNDQALFMQNIEGLQNQSNNIMFSLEEAQELISKNQQEITKMSKNIAENKAKIIEKKALRDSLIREIYTSGGFQNIAYLVFSSESISDLFSKKINLSSAQEKTLEQINAIGMMEDDLRKNMEEMVLKRENLENQIDGLENQLSSLRSMIDDNYDSYYALEENRMNTEGQITDPNVKISTQNKRDFIWWNTLDFAQKNNITFYGSGTAHGLGMSQYGAKAMAEQGNSYSKILTYYYRGTRLGNIDTKDTIIRVRVSSSTAGGNVFVRGGKANYINGNDKKELQDGELMPAVPGARFVPQDSATVFQLDYKGDAFDTYRGVIEIVSATNGGIYTINHIYLEDYLRGVVPSEMSANWNEEALKAQAIAARNYAYKSLNSASNYDICDTQACQVYLGYNHEFTSTDLAITKTKGEFLYYGSDLVTAYYFSSSGGWTENNENVWGGAPIPYLRGVPSLGESSPYNSWNTATMSKENIQNILNSNSKTSVGDLQKLAITKRGVSGRVMAIKITGSDGEKTVSGNTFKTILNLGINDGNYLKDILFGVK